MYRRGHLKVDLDFEYASDFIGLAADARTGRYLPSVFLLLAGSSRPWDSLRWIPGTTGINAPLHVLTLKHRSRSGSAGAGSNDLRSIPGITGYRMPDDYKD